MCTRISLACAYAKRVPVSHPFVHSSSHRGPSGGSPPPLANIRAVTTSRNHTALAPRVALSGAAEVGRSTVTAGCTAEAYANRLDFARMAFLFVVKNGACEPRDFRDDPLLRERPCVWFSSRAPLDLSRAWDQPREASSSSEVPASTRLHFHCRLPRIYARFS